MTLVFLKRQPDQFPEYSLPADPDIISRINSWRLAQTPVPTESEAILALVRLGLATAVPAREAATKAPPTKEEEAIEAMARQFRHFSLTQKS